LGSVHCNNLFLFIWGCVWKWTIF